ncbi:MAG: flippase-like domain-containing protein [Bacteroidales bacterium]|nr:flippase-like domain-containing protein [Bacteroidales bacterium]
METITTPRSKKKIVMEVLKYTFFSALTAYLVWSFARSVDWPKVAQALKQANYWWIGLSMLVGWVAILVRAQRWRILIEPLNYRPSLKNTYDAVMLTYLANFALPRMGEVVRCGALRKSEKIPFDSLLGTVVLERIFDVFCLLVIVVSVIFMRMETFGAFMYDKIWQPLMEKSGGSFSKWLLIAAIIGFAGLTLIIVFRKRLLKIGLIRKTVKLFSGLIDGLKAGFRLKKYKQFFAYTLLLWLLYFMQSYTIMKSMPETQGLFMADALFLMVVGSFGWVMPVQGGLGAFHYMVSLALVGIYAVDAGMADAFAIISHESQSVVMIFFGFISLIAISLKFKVYKVQSSK